MHHLQHPQLKAQMNADIMHEEVEAVLKRLQRYEAAGVDGVKA